MAKRIIIGNADFSQNAIEIRHKLVSSMLEQGLIAKTGGIRPPSGGNDYMNRASLITNTPISEFPRITLPDGMQWCATFFDENGNVVATAEPTWIKNQTGMDKTFYIDTAANYTSTAYYYQLGFGYIDGSQLDKEAFDSIVNVFLDEGLPTELRITSSMVEYGMLDINGNPNTEVEAMKKRISFRHQTFLSDYSRIYIPAGIKWAVLYRTDENVTANTSDALNAWTTTPGDSSGGIVNITSAVKQSYAQATGATSYYLTFGRIDNEKLYEADLDTTYEIKLLR